MKRCFALLLVACMLCAVLCACAPKENITPEEAVEVVMKDLDKLADKAESPHVHEGTYNNQPCYNIYVTVNGVSLTYVISMRGKILHSGPGQSHSH